MNDRDIIHDFLKSLAKYLSRLEKADADDVIREIESHIYDALDNGEGEVRAEVILDGFGNPRELAAQYVDHILEGTPPPSGFRAIQRVRKQATKGLYFATGVLGYLSSLFLILVALIKPFKPEQTAVWVSEHGNSIVIGAISEAPAGAQDILGWWIVPVALGLGTFLAYLTNRLLRVLKEKI
jgi:hypothetical protein